MPQVIEWTNAGSEEIIYRYPNEDITWGAQLIVHEYEMAVFFRDGKAYDVFGPGRHTLTTLNLPLLTSLLTRLAGFGGQNRSKPRSYTFRRKFLTENSVPAHKQPSLHHSRFSASSCSKSKTLRFSSMKWLEDKTRSRQAMLIISCEDS